MMTPPQWPLKFLRWFCPAELSEEIEGDLYEHFYRDLDRYGYNKSKRRFIWNALRFFRPGIIRRNSVNSKFGFMVMFTTNLRVALRVILRNKLVSAFSISGLVIGLASAMLMALWLHNEFSFDSYHNDLDQIYQVYSQRETSGETITWPVTPRILAPTLKESYPFISHSASYATYGEDFVFQANDKKMVNDRGVFTDQDFLDIFSFEYLSGSPESALNDPNSIILTRSFAELLFGSEQVMGETVSVSSEGASFDFRVSAVIEDLPSNTDFYFEYIIGFRFIENIFGKDENWSNNSVRTYVKLKADADPAEGSAQLSELIKTHTKSEESNHQLLLYPFERVHLHGQFENGHESGGKITVLRLLGILTLSLVLVACINFVNISTARAQKRSKEIGIRKTIGAQRGALTTQFLFESVLMVLLAGIGALALASYSLPWFNRLMNHDVVIPWGNLSFWLIFSGVLVLTGVLAGLYPAVVLSSLKPVQSMNGKGGARLGRNIIRQGLVVFQFGFAIQLIFSTFVIQSQIRHIQNREAGYNKSDLVYHQLTPAINSSFETYKNRLLNSGQVESVTRTSSPLTDQFSNSLGMKWTGKEEGDDIVVERFHAGDDFLSTIGASLVMGREMDIESYASDSNAVLINQAAVDAMGFDEPIGAIINDGGQDWKVVGVVNDFIFFNPIGEIPPLVIFNGSANWFNGVHIRLKGDTESALQLVSDVFREIDDAYPFDYSFIEDKFNAKFSGVKRTLLFSTVFGMIIVIIACAGLFAMSIYLISNKMNEIGVRKVFGSSTFSIVRLLCWKSIIPILVAIVLFSPVAWMSMDWWLRTQPYRISLDISYLIISATTLILIALSTVIFQASRAAATNPKDVLRME